MAFPLPQFSKNQINRAGEIIKAPGNCSSTDQEWATEVLANYRACHGYPINTFQATLRGKLRSIDPNAIVAQRLKRTPSIVLKLQRFHGMQLARMQDIGGLRAVLSSVKLVRQLEKSYRDARFKHTLTSSKDYIAEPKADGYRGVHLIYRYNNENAAEYNGLSLELQIRSRLQHAWATAVETMGTFLGQALKSGQGETRWREFFVKASAALSCIEKSPQIPGFEGYDEHAIFRAVAETEASLRVLEKLQGFAIAADQIIASHGQGAYHLIVLDSEKRTVTITPYATARLEIATNAYAKVEARTRNGEPVEAVLVSAGPIESLRRAYPNYFLDTQEFIREIKAVIAKSQPKRSATNKVVNGRRRKRGS
ncbi:MAG: RelA/SpoT domain-containing protein [Planctomycetaceae bacterium]